MRSSKNWILFPRSFSHTGPLVGNYCTLAVGTERSLNGPWWWVTLVNGFGFFITIEQGREWVTMLWCRLMRRLLWHLPLFTVRFRANNNTDTTNLTYEAFVSSVRVILSLTSPKQYSNAATSNYQQHERSSDGTRSYSVVSKAMRSSSNSCSKCRTIPEECRVGPHTPWCSNDEGTRLLLQVGSTGLRIARTTQHCSYGWIPIGLLSCGPWRPVSKAKRQPQQHCLGAISQPQ